MGVSETYFFPYEAGLLAKVVSDGRLLSRIFADPVDTDDDTRLGNFRGCSDGMGGKGEWTSDVEVRTRNHRRPHSHSYALDPEQVAYRVCVEIHTVTWYPLLGSIEVDHGAQYTWTGRNETFEKAREKMRALYDDASLADRGCVAPEWMKPAELQFASGRSAVAPCEDASGWLNELPDELWTDVERATMLRLHAKLGEALDRAIADDDVACIEALVRSGRARPDATHVFEAARRSREAFDAVFSSFSFRV